MKWKKKIILDEGEKKTKQTRSNILDLDRSQKLATRETIVIKLGLEIDPIKGPGLRFYGSTRDNP